MRSVTHKGRKELTLLELVLQLHGDFRRSLEPIRVTPLQAGVLLFLRRHADARLTDAAVVPGRHHLSRTPEGAEAVTRNVGYTSRRSFDNGNRYGAVGFGAGRPVSCWEQRSMRGHA
jgi:hypothetical protein